MLHRRRSLRDLAVHGARIGVLEEVEAVVRDLFGPMLLERRLDHPGAMDSVPNADLQETPRPLPLNRSAQVAVSIGHTVAQTVQRSPKSPGRIQLAGMS